MYSGWMPPCTRTHSPSQHARRSTGKQAAELLAKQAGKLLAKQRQEATSHSKPLEERGAGVLERRERRRSAGERRWEAEDSDSSSHERVF